MKCNKCNDNWEEEYLSIIRLYSPGLKRITKSVVEFDEIKICENCRSKIWTNFFA